MAKEYTRRCTYRAVKFEFDTDPTFVAVRHGLDCKKASGGEAATFFGVPEEDLTRISGNPKSFHYIAQSDKGLTLFIKPQTQESFERWKRTRFGMPD